ncbi:MAG TPA: hypothetical protein VKV26_04800 [Dehalococcoidia bacterium]|nr:hypothetical protein [Dehalococcoidia bacterium]
MRTSWQWLSGAALALALLAGGLGCGSSRGASVHADATPAVPIATVQQTVSAPQQTPSGPDLAPFVALMQNASCAQSRNRLYEIDGTLLFWERAGFCADAGYAYTLYNGSPDQVLCQLNDSIAGPRRSCDPAYADLFDTITHNLDALDLGLGPDHSVALVQEVRMR